MEKRFKFYEKELEYWIYDNVTKKNYTMYDLCYLVDLLNEQDQKIKKQEEEIKQLKFDCAMYKSANYLINDVGLDKAREIMFQTEKKLKQSQNSKAIEVLEKVKEIILEERKESAFRFDTFSKGKDTALFWINEQTNNQIAELRGGK